MSNLSGANIGLNFKGLLNLGSTINTPLSATLQAITDGDGIASPLFLSTNEVAVRGTTNAQRLIIDADAGVGKLLSFRSGNIQRWAIRVDGTESGANAGADIAFRRYNDAGTFIDSPITLTRSTGFITLGKRVSYTGATGTSLLNFPDSGTTAADGISFGSGSSNLYRVSANELRSDGALRLGGTLLLLNGSVNSSTGILNLNTVFSINSVTGLTSLFPPTLTGSSATSALSIAQTWNTTGNPTAIDLNVTNTASGVGSLLLNLRVGGNSVMSVSSFGTVSSVASFQVSGSGGFFRAPSNGYLQFVARSRIYSEGDGLLRITNDGNTDFNRIQFGGTTSSFPSLKRSGTNLQVRLADDSGFGFIEDLYRRSGSGSPEGVVTAPVGAIYHRTDGGAGTSFYVKESGTGNTGWVAK